MRHALVFAIALLGCAEPKPRPGWGIKAPPPLAAPVVENRVVIASSRPSGSLVTTSGWLVPAALRAGGTIALLPGGSARVDKVTEIDVVANGMTRKLIGYAITGLGLSPEFTWFDANGAWFGNVSSWISVVPTGWESVVDPLIARQDELEKARSAQPVNVPAASE